MILKGIRGTIRALGFFFGGLLMMFRIAMMDLFKGRDLGRAIRYRLHFIRWFIPFFGVKLEVLGDPPREAGLIMCDHRCYFDPVPILNYVWALPVSRADVSGWPIIGIGARLSGTVFVDRSSPETRQAARDTINSHLKEGFSILIYPEGTIHPGPRLGELKVGMFRDAAKNGYPIHPAAIEYKYPEDAWLGGKSFVRHFFSRFGQKNVHVKISFGPSIKHDDPEVLINHTREWIDQEIPKLREDWYDTPSSS